jgi:hypothetical protein
MRWVEPARLARQPCRRIVNQRLRFIEVSSKRFTLTIASQYESLSRTLAVQLHIPAVRCGNGTVRLIGSDRSKSYSRDSPCFFDCGAYIAIRVSTPPAEFSAMARCFPPLALFRSSSVGLQIYSRCVPDSEADRPAAPDPNVLVCAEPAITAKQAVPSASRK